MITARLGARRDEMYFWATHTGAEITLVVIRGRRRLGFEFKRTIPPGITRPMGAALADFWLDRINVLHAGGETLLQAKSARAVGLTRVWKDLEPLLPWCSQ